MQSTLTFLLHSTLCLAVVGCLVYVILKITRCRSARMHALAWAFVLLQGVLWFHIPLELHLAGTPAPPPQISATEEPDFTQRVTEITPPGENVYSPGYSPFAQPQVASEEEHAASVKTVTVSPPQRTFPSVPVTIFSIWITGIVLILFRHAFLLHEMLRSLKGSQPVEGVFEKEWRMLLEKYRISPKRIRLVFTERTGPGLIGMLGFYQIVVPRALWEEADAAMRRGILEHELSHFRHKDPMKSLALRSIALLHWFNPIAHLALRRFESALEWRCDAEAFGQYEDGSSDFARILLVFRDLVPVRAVYRHDFLGNDLISRTRRLVEYQHNRKGDSLMKKTLILVSLTLLLFAGTLKITVTQRTYAETPTETTEEPEASELVDEKPEPSAPLGEKDPVFVKLHGKVLLPDGKPATNMMFMTSGDGKSTSSSGPMRQRDGSFTISSFPNGDYMISVFDPKGVYSAASQYYTVKNEAEYAEEILFQLREGVRVEGTVYDETTGKPIPEMDISVAIYPKGENHNNFTHFKTKADENGKYHFAAAPEDEVYVNVGYLPVPVSMKEMKMIGDEKIDQKLKMRLNRLKKVEFPESTPNNPTVTIDFRIPPPFVGRVLTESGAPLPKCIVQFAPSGKFHLLNSSFDFAETDKNGYFRLCERPRNTFVYINQYNPIMSQVYTGWITDELPEEGVAEFRLQLPCAIKGRLIDSVTKTPLADQLLLYERSSKDDPDLRDYLSATTRTDKDGNFIIKDAVPNVRYELYIVPGRQQYHGANPELPRVILGSVIPETPKEIITLGDLEIDREHLQLR